MIIASFFVIIVLAAIGFHSSENNDGSPTAILSALYKSLQLFGLNFDLKDGVEPNWALQFARFGAALYVGGGAVLFLSKGLREWVAIGWQCLGFPGEARRAIVVGYGVVGQAAAFQLKRQGYQVTAFDSQADDEARRARARDDGVLLIGGVVDVEATLVKLRPYAARLLVICLGDDRATLESARMLARMTPQLPHRHEPPPQIRLLMREPAIVRSVAEGDTEPALPRDRVSAFDFAALVAEDLCQRARFDRTALEAGQERVHIVLFGAGTQGLAILSEVLLTAWRVALAPPRVTVVDRHADAIEHRLHAAAPALFLDETAGGIPKDSCPQVEFHPLDVDHLLAEADLSGKLVEPVTAYVFACGDDETNLRGAIALRQRIGLHTCDPAPIHVRLRERENDAGADLGFGTIDFLCPFGGLAGIIGRSGVLSEDPDRLPRQAHAAYQAAELALFGESTDWQDLTETLRVANRRLYRHAIQKLEDVGLQWPLYRGSLPAVPPEVAKAPLAALDSLDFAAPQFPPSRLHSSPDVALMTLAADREHDRWMTERALSGWRAAARVDPALRDNDRRIHPNLHPWIALSPAIRRYDVTFLRGLLIGATGTEASACTAPSGLPVAHPKSVARYALAHFGAGPECGWRLLADKIASPTAPTEIQIAIRERSTGQDDAVRAVAAALDAAGPALSRVVLVFCRPPGASGIALGEALAIEASRRELDVSVRWSWSRASWPVKIGFAGHLDLDRVGGEAAATRRLEAAFARLALEVDPEALVAGYAPGADQVAVRIWRALGFPAPCLLFPYRGADGTSFVTEDGEGVPGSTRFTPEDLKGLGAPVVVDAVPGENAHVTQATTLVRGVDRLVVLWDGEPADGPGGTGDAVHAAGDKPVLYA